MLKVLYRNTNRIQEHGGRATEVLHPVEPAEPSARAARRPRPSATPSGARTWTGPSRSSPRWPAASADDAFNDLLVPSQDHTEVHRVVLPYRAWDLLDLIGKEQAHTLLRQSVRYCVKAETQDQHGPR